MKIYSDKKNKRFEYLKEGTSHSNSNIRRFKLPIRIISKMNSKISICGCHKDHILNIFNENCTFN